MEITRPYRFLLYNIRYCTGSGWKFHAPVPFSGYLRRTRKVLPKISAFIKSCHPDITGLIEVDGGSVRTGGSNQAGRIAERLGHHYTFETKYENPFLYRHMPLMRNQGNALLAGKRIVNRRCHYFEKGIKRLVIEVELDQMVCILVHLSIRYAHRQEQLSDLSDLINNIQKPLVVAGDFNIFSGPGELDDFLETTRLMSANGLNLPTFPSKKPRWELDYIFFSPDISVHNIHIPRVTLSDHLPLVCDFTIPSPGA